MCDEASEPLGLLMPPGIVQPLSIEVSVDDVHVIVWLRNHRRYESVEAMIRQRPGETPWVRAILTRHDQSQIDHLNDLPTATRMSHATPRRERVLGPIGVELSKVNGAPLARVEFRTGDGEHLVFCLQALVAPRPDWGGLTDPGGHAADSSLPIMLRARSAPAGIGTAVLIDGQAVELAPSIGRPAPGMGLRGFYTEDHQLGLIRADCRQVELRAAPSSMSLGAQWHWQSSQGDDLIYRIERDRGSGHVEIVRVAPDSRETIVARVQGDCLCLEALSVRAHKTEGRDLTLRFLPAGRFALSMNDSSGLVRGQVRALASPADACAYLLAPDAPDWAARRPIRLSMSQTGRTIACQTQIGLDCDKLGPR